MSLKKAEKSTRDPQLLHPDLQRLWNEMQDWWKKNGDGSRVFLTQTTRGCDEQQKYYEQGRSRAQCGQSLHNYEPALAFDVAFEKKGGGLDWSTTPFKKFGEECVRRGFEWGGNWKGFYDGPHIQLPMTWQQASKGEVVSVYNEAMVVPAAPVQTSTNDESIKKLLVTCRTALDLAIKQM